MFGLFRIALSKRRGEKKRGKNILFPNHAFFGTETYCPGSAGSSLDPNKWSSYSLDVPNNLLSLTQPCIPLDNTNLIVSRF